MARMKPKPKTKAVPLTKKKRKPATKYKGKGSGSNPNSKNNKGHQEKFTPEQIIEALREMGGFVTKAADMLGCNYRTLENYFHKYPEILEARKEIDNGYLDLAEFELLKLVKDGDKDALKFYLKCKGKGRGYIEGVHNINQDMGDDNWLTFIKKTYGEAEDKEDKLTNGES